MMKMKIKINKITPLLMATMMLAPSILIESTYAVAQTNHRKVSRDSGGKSDTQIIQLKNFNSYFRRYIGKLSFRVEDDPKVKRARRIFNTQNQVFQNSAAQLQQKKDAQNAARTKSANIRSKISKLEKNIIQALTEETNLKKQIPKLKKQLTNLSQQAKLAQKAFVMTEADLKAVNTKITAAKADLKSKKDACKATPTPACQQQVKAAQKVLVTLKQEKPPIQGLFEIAKKDRDTKQANIAAKKKILKEKKQKVATLEAQNTKRTASLNHTKQAAKHAQDALNTTINATRAAKRDYKIKLQARNSAATGLNNLKERIVIRVNRLNKIGAKLGNEAGTVDGDYYAEYLGQPQGQNDGDRDGRESGTTAGRQTSYDQGLAQGEVEGRSQAQINGLNDGKVEGAKAGHMAIAMQRGKYDGIQRAQNSDASQVGKNQGASAGLARAIDTGNKKGTQKGEDQAIHKNESDANGYKSIAGQFAGAFSARTPDYPGFNCIERAGRRYHRDEYEWRRFRDWAADRSICPNFKPMDNGDIAHARRRIFKEAFLDGYLIRYRGARREQFLRSIDHYYSPTYNQARDAAFEDFSTRTYPDQIESGRQKGYLTAYNSTYPSVKDRYYKQYYTSAYSNPDTKNPNYTSTYASVENSNYRSKYEDIRANAYTVEEQNIFNQNIVTQTDKYRKIRFAQVDKIYATTPVLKYVSTKLHDAGINGIAKNDGIFQPGENIVHDVTIKNFGSQAATAVTIKIEGKTFALPAIAAKSTVTVKGAGLTQVTTRLGRDHAPMIEVYSPLTAQASIQGRHYFNLSKNKINFGDMQIVPVKYPITLADLKTKSQLLINNKNGLELNATNISNRKYTGQLDIEVEVDSHTDIISKKFSSLNGLTGSVNLNDAQLLIASERDVYTPLSFSAKILKNGVVLGILPNTFTTMAKTPFSQRAEKPVILVNSEHSAKDLMKAVASYGGLSQVSVLDTTLDSLNAEVYANGLNKKSVIVIDDTRGVTVPNLGRLLKKLENSSVVFVDYSARGLSIALNSARELKHAATLPNLIDGFAAPVNLHYTNNFIDGVVGMNIIVQASFDNYKKMVKSLANFNFTKSEIIPAAGSALNKSNVTKADNSVRTMISMAAGQVVNASLAYKASNNNEKLVNFIKSDAPIFQRVLKQSGKKVKRKTLSKNLAAIAMFKVLEHAVDKYAPMDDNIDYDIKRPFKSAMKKMMLGGSGISSWFSKGTWNYLKKYDKGLYNTIDDNPYAQSPFKM